MPDNDPRCEELLTALQVRRFATNVLDSMRSGVNSPCLSNRGLCMYQTAGARRREWARINATIPGVENERPAFMCLDWSPLTPRIEGVFDDV